MEPSYLNTALEDADTRALLLNTLSIHDLLIKSDGIVCKLIQAMHKMPKTPMQCGSCVSAFCKCHYYNVILSEFRTKEITSAPLGLITVHVWPINSQNTDQPDQNDRTLKAPCI